jgi:hypothetical protein
MIKGAHAIVYSKNPDADRAFFKNVLKLPHVDVGQGWLIFALPSAEVALHPSRKNDVHELYLTCDDIRRFVQAMKRRRLACTEVADRGWGLITFVTLPGGGKLGVYQPRHAQPSGTRPAATAVSRRRSRATRPQR